jgi:hypothetical protein
MKRFNKYGLASTVEFKCKIGPTAANDVTAPPITGAIFEPPESQAKN